MIDRCDCSLDHSSSIMTTMMTTMNAKKSVSCRHGRSRKLHRFQNNGIASLLLLALIIFIILAIVDLGVIVSVESSFSSSYSSSTCSHHHHHHNVQLFPRQGRGGRRLVPGSFMCGLWQSLQDPIHLPVVNDKDERDDDEDNERTIVLRNEHHDSCLLAVTKTATTTTSSSSRRETLQTMTHSLAAASALLVTSWQLPFLPPANAAAAAADMPTTADSAVIKPSIVPAADVLQRLRPVPVYAIVDGLGIPFMTYDSESAGANGYFFLDYTNAQGVLQDAQRAYQSAKEKQVEGVSDTWGDSRIVTLPLDLALRLTVKQVSNVAQNDKAFRTIYQVLPSADDLETALRLENSMRYRQRGRVPLFYVDGFQLPNGMTPAYFSTKDLRMAWNQQQQQQAQQPLLNSQIQVRELSETFRAMIKPGGTDESVRNLVFVPSSDSVQVAAQLRKAQVGEVYKIGKIVLTK